MVNKVFCLETEWEQSVYDLKYDESNIAYNGQVNIAQNKKVSVTFNLEVGLPEN